MTVDISQPVIGLALFLASHHRGSLLHFRVQFLFQVLGEGFPGGVRTTVTGDR